MNFVAVKTIKHKLQFHDSSYPGCATTRATKRSETKRKRVVLRVDNGSHNKEVNNSDLFEYAFLLKSTYVRIGYFLYEANRITGT